MSSLQSEDLNAVLTTNTPPNYRQQCQQLIAQLLTLNTSTQWHYVHTYNTIQIYHIQYNTTINSVDTTVTCFKGIGIVQGNIRAVLDLLTDTSKKVQYDELFSQHKVIDEVDITTRIENWKYWACDAVIHAPFPISKRDFCVLGHACRLTDNTLILAGTSIQHQQCPVVKDVVRGNMFGGYILKSVNENETLVTYIGQADLKGTLPEILRHKLGMRQPMIIKYLSNITAEYSKQCTAAYLQQQYNKLPVYTVDGQIADTSETTNDIVHELYDDIVTSTDSNSSVQHISFDSIHSDNNEYVTSISGYLYKSGKLFRHKIKRYYVLNMLNKTLVYKIKHTDTTIKNMIQLNDRAKIIALNECTFELVCNLHSYILTAECSDDKLKWIHAIQQCIGINTNIPLLQSNTTAVQHNGTVQTIDSDTESKNSTHRKLLTHNDRLYNQSISITRHVRRATQTEILPSNDTNAVARSIAGLYTDSATTTTIDISKPTVLFSTSLYLMCIAWLCLLMFILNVLNADTVILRTIVTVLMYICLCSTVFISDMVAERKYCDVLHALVTCTSISMAMYTVSISTVQCIVLCYIVYNTCKALLLN